MSDETLLWIHLAEVSIQPQAQEVRWNQHHGCRAVLLQWLETQLGLLRSGNSSASRVTQFAAGLDQIADACFSRSLATDRWATAAELLAKRDALRLAGWDEADAPQLPLLVRDLARAGQAGRLRLPGEAERLWLVLAAFDDGQKLPPHRCVLFDPLERWPRLWQDVLQRLNVQSASEVDPAALGDTAMGRVQRGISNGEALTVAFDPSLRWISSQSLFTACEAIASALANALAGLSNTVVCCESDTAAICLDGCLHRIGLPTMGASMRSLAHPALQVLPLALALCWEPVDPEQLLDFLSLPIGPVPKGAAARLAAALAKQPGFGSGAWISAMDELCSPDNDSEQTLRGKLQYWLEPPRVARGGLLPMSLVGDRCGRVAQWAAGRAAMLDNDPTQHALRATLLLAAAQATELGELAQTQAGDLTEPQLARLHEAAAATSAESMPFIEAVGGPRLVRSLSDIDGPVDNVIWLGLGTSQSQSPRWTAHELRQLRDTGIDLDDGTHLVAALRDAERRGLQQVRGSLLAVSLPTDDDQAKHPVWIQVLGMFPPKQKPVSLEDLLAGDTGCEESEPWQFATQCTAVEPAQPQRLLWKLPSGLVQDRDSSSATELIDRLACPLKWVFHYSAKLTASPIAHLPNDFLLNGNFCHSLLSQVFGQGNALPTAEEAGRRVAEMFDRRLSLDAAPLAQAHRIAERQRLRDDLLKATGTLIKSLQDGGYQTISLEVPVSAELDGRKLTGSIDCLAIREDRSEAVIDFKYGSRTKYRNFLRDGRAVQLATYCYGRTSENGGVFPSAAYLMLSDGLLHTPSGSPIAGAGEDKVVRDAPAIQETWLKFITALDRAEQWLDGAEPIPARPLQEAKEWPDGAEIVLVDPAAVSNSEKFEYQAVCQYCDYQPLCGLQELI